MQREDRVAILFADICGSSHVYRALGDTLAHEILARRIEILIAVTQECQGTLVKTLGDEVMTTFHSADAAADAAVKMQERTTGTLVAEGPQLKIRVGFHYGPVLIDGADIYGEAVNVAARMANQATAGQVVTTSATVALMSTSWRAAAQRIEALDHKGKRERGDAYELIWQPPDLALAGERRPANADRVGDGKLILVGADKHIEIDAERPTLTVGRGDGNDLVIKYSVVSRLHARVEYHEGHFMLIDQSSNGTYVVSASGKSTYFRRNKCVLEGAGVIGLGKAPVPDSPLTVRYETRLAPISSAPAAIESDH